MDNLQAARELTSRIRAHAVRDDYPALVAIDADPETGQLLDLLSNDLVSAARIHLEAARRWKQRKEEANRRRIDEARAALDHFDLDLTRALLGRIEEDWLTPADAASRDDLLLVMEARTMETEELADRATDAIAEERPPRRWWQRR